MEEVFRATYVTPRPQHPSPMLIQPQHLHIDIHNTQSPYKHCTRHSIHCLRRPVSPKGLIRNHKRTRRTDETQYHNLIPVYTMEKYHLVPDDGYKLEAYKEPGGQNGRKMEDDADTVTAATLAGVVVAFAGGGAAALRGVAEDVVNVEEHEAGEGETHHCTGGDEEEGEVVPVGEVERFVKFGEKGDDPRGWR